MYEKREYGKSEKKKMWNGNEVTCMQPIKNASAKRHLRIFSLYILEWRSFDHKHCSVYNTAFFLYHRIIIFYSNGSCCVGVSVSAMVLRIFQAQILIWYLPKSHFTTQISEWIIGSWPMLWKSSCLINKRICSTSPTTETILIIEDRGPT